MINGASSYSVFGTIGTNTNNDTFSLDSYKISHGKQDFYIVRGECNEEIVDVLTSDDTETLFSETVEAIKLYLNHLSTRKIKKSRIVFSVPRVGLIKSILDSIPVYSITVQNKRLVLTVYTDMEVYKTESVSQEVKHQLVDASKNISQALRKAHFQTSEKFHGIRKMPLVGHPCEGVIAGSLGAFPEFILPTFPCEKTVQGYCAPCFFSKVSMSDSNRDDIYKSFEVQTKFIIDNFDEQVIKCQLRSDKETKNRWDATLCFASNGSLFSNCETTREGRYKAFKMLYDEISKRKLSSLVYIETCADDYLNFLDSDEAAVLIPLMQRLNVVVLCGFESAQDFTRDVLYTKSLMLSEFESVVMRNRVFGLQTGAFLYAGFHSMTQSEIVIDLTKSLCYLLKLDAVPVIMVPKLHDFTLPDLLFRFGRYNIIDPYTLLNIAEIVAWIADSIPSPLKKDRWLMSDLLDDIPPSSTSIINNDRKTICMSCATEIRDSLQRIRSNMDYSIFSYVEDTIKKCPNGCYEKMLKQLKEEDNIRKEKSLLARTFESTDYASRKKRQYIQSLWDQRTNKKQLISIIKKELLCYGLNVDKFTLEKLHALNKSFGEAKFVHVAQIRLPDGSYVNAPVLEEYCRLSPYSLLLDEISVTLLKNGIEIYPITISPMPAWIDKKLSDGTPITSIISVHGHNTLALVRHNECYYKKLGRGCRYCSSDEYFNNERSCLPSELQIAEAVQLALDNGNNYSLALSGGTIEPPDRGAVFFSNIVKEVLKKSPNVGISVEMAPPESNFHIDMLIDAGVKSLIMNLEFFDENVRHKYCPGKSEISTDRYVEALKYAVSKLGSGRISSVLIAGLEDIESTIAGAKMLISIGVVPTIMPFRPYDNCEMRDHPVSHPSDLSLIEYQLNKYIEEQKVNYKRPYGCLSCNACIGTELCLSYRKDSDINLRKER